jgi:hypothetical protein
MVLLVWNKPGVWVVRLNRLKLKFGFSLWIRSFHKLQPAIFSHSVFMGNARHLFSRIRLHKKVSKLERRMLVIICLIITFGFEVNLN